MVQDTKASVTSSNDVNMAKTEELIKEVASKPLLAQNSSASLSFEVKKEKGAITSGDNINRQRHRWTEHSRRRKISGMISTLHHYLPRAAEKLDQVTVLEETVRYIKSLNHTLETLQNNRKLERLCRSVLYHAPSSKSQGLIKVDLNAPPPPKPEAITDTEVSSWESPEVTYSIQGEDAHIRVCTKRRLGLFASVVELLQKRGIQIMTVQIFSHDNLSVFIIHACACGADDQSSKVVPSAELIYKLAVRDLSIRLSSPF